MTGALVRKELVEHRTPFALLGLAALALLGLLVWQARDRPMAGSELGAVRTFLIIGAPLAASVFSERLLRREFTGRTQLFLETLPVTRLRILAVKLALGFALLVALVALALGAGLLLAMRREPVTPSLAVVLATRSLAFALFLWCFFSALGLLGRYRTPLLIALAAAVILLTMLRDFEPDRVGPLALLRDFASAGAVVQGRDLLWTAATSAGLLALTFAMGLAREGSVAAALAHSMSRRERAFLIGGALAMLTGLGAFGEKLLRKPLQLPQAATVETEGVAVAVSRKRSEDADAEDLARRLHHELSALRSYLGLAALPRLLVARRADLDPGVYELSTGADPGAVLVRVRHPHPAWDERDFLAWLVPHLLDHRSGGRLLHEPKRWIAEGVGHFWARREAAGASLSRSARSTPRTARWLATTSTAGSW